MSPESTDSPSTTHPGAPLELRRPTIADGAQMWRVARDSVRLDLNPPYAYLLWARDFADASVVAEQDGTVGGFVTGYRRPEDPSTLMVWQVAVDEGLRGQGVAGRMLDEIVERTGALALETTITDDNPASTALFEALARRHGVQLHVNELFEATHFPGEGFKPERLHRAAPLRAS